jgi:hypothetical protein
MRRTLALAATGLAVAAAVLPVTTASACDPTKPPWCNTPCSIAQDAYTFARNTAGVGPAWSNLDLGVCGTR